MNAQSHNFSGAEAPSPTPPSPVGAEMVRLRERNEALHELVGTLEERLVSVLRPLPPRPVGEAGKGEAAESPLHGALRGQAELLAGAG